MAYRMAYSGGLRNVPVAGTGGVTTNNDTANRAFFNAASAAGITVLADAIDTGRYGLQLAPSAAAALVSNNVSDAATDTKQGVCFRGKINSGSIATNMVIQGFSASTTTDSWRIRVTTAGGLEYTTNGSSSFTAFTGFPTIAVGNVFRLDCYVDWTAATSTHTFRVALWYGGVRYTQVITGGASVVTADSAQVGPTGAAASTSMAVCDMYWYDDIAQWNAMDDHRVWGMNVSASGTHHATKFTSFQTDASVALSSASETTSWQQLDDAGSGATDTTTFIKQVTADATADAYAEYQFDDLPANSGQPLFVQYDLLGFPLAAVTANSFGFRLNDGGTVSAEAAFDLSVAASTLEYHANTYAAPPSGGDWTPAKVNALRGRIGFSANDVSPVPAVSALYLDCLCDFTSRKSVSLPSGAAIPRASRW